MHLPSLQPDMSPSSRAWRWTMLVLKATRGGALLLDSSTGGCFGAEALMAVRPMADMTACVAVCVASCAAVDRAAAKPEAVWPDSRLAAVPFATPTGRASHPAVLSSRVVAMARPREVREGALI